MSQSSTTQQKNSKSARRLRLQEKRQAAIGMDVHAEKPGAEKPVDHRAGVDPTLRSVMILEFTEARSQELQMLHSAHAAPISTRRAFQTLPRHLRRRTASHYPNKLPLRLRERAAREVAGSVPKGPGKKPSRAHKRRPKYLREKQIQHAISRTGIVSQSFDADSSLSSTPSSSSSSPLIVSPEKPYWMPTHIWHAKRFHMISRWGYRIPYSPTLKFFRGAYRASIHLATLYDASYFAWFRFATTSSDVLSPFLRRFLPPGSPSPFHPRYFSAHHALSTCLFLPQTDPSSSSNPSSPSSSPSPRPIAPVKFIWSAGPDHPQRVLWMLVHPAAQHELRSLFRQIDPSRAVCFSLHPALFAYFQLRGARSHAVLNRTLLPNRWPSNAPSLPADTALPLNDVQDPRYVWPPAKVPLPFSGLDDDDNDVSSILSSSSSSTPTTSSSYFSELLSAPVDHAWQVPLEGQLNAQRHALPRPAPATVPILALRTPARDDRAAPQDTASGWDVVVPVRWAHSFWTAFKAAGVRVIGLREKTHQEFEQGIPSFPLEYIDSHAYAVDAIERRDALQAEYDKKPPSKKPNFTRIAGSQALLPDWHLLVGAPSRLAEDTARKCPQLTDDSDVTDATHPKLTDDCDEDEGKGGVESKTGALLELARNDLSFHLSPCVSRAPWFADETLCYTHVHLRKGRAQLHASIIVCSTEEANAWKSSIVMFDPAVHVSVGYVITSGKYSFSRGYGFGIAVVSAAFLRNQNSTNPLISIFLRNPTSQHLHLGKLSLFQNSSFFMN